MGIERTLVIIKPEHIDCTDAIFAELDTLAQRIATARVDSVPLEIAKQHCAPHIGRDYYDWLIKQLAGNPAIPAIYEGDDVICIISNKVGHKDPAKSLKDTIRGKYSNDSESKARAERRATANVIHRSTSMSEYEREIKIWRSYKIVGRIPTDLSVR